MTQERSRIGTHTLASDLFNVEQLSRSSIIRDGKQTATRFVLGSAEDATSQGRRPKAP
jgi:hypothetical protein